MLESSISPRSSATRRGNSIPGISLSVLARGPFLEMGKTDRAMDFVHLDAGSEWAAWVTPYVYLTEGNVAEARESAKNMARTPIYHRELMEACTAAQRPADLARIVRENESSVMLELDAEPGITWAL